MDRLDIILARRKVDPAMPEAMRTRKETPCCGAGWEYIMAEAGDHTPPPPTE